MFFRKLWLAEFGVLKMVTLIRFIYFLNTDYNFIYSFERGVSVAATLRPIAIPLIITTKEL